MRAPVEQVEDLAVDQKENKPYRLISTLTADIAFPYFYTEERKDGNNNVVIVKRINTDKKAIIIKGGAGVVQPQWHLAKGYTAAYNTVDLTEEEKEEIEKSPTFQKWQKKNYLRIIKKNHCDDNKRCEQIYLTMEHKNKSKQKTKEELESIKNRAMPRGAEGMARKTL